MYQVGGEKGISTLQLHLYTQWQHLVPEALVLDSS